MAQTTNYEIANSSGLIFRGRVNEVFAAVQSNNSGATEPTGTVAYQLWYDTTTNILKMRNASNAAWINLFTVDQTNGVWSVNANSTSDALRITQTGTGNALLVEDNTNPDSTPFVVTSSGNVGIGITTPSTALEVVGQASFDDGTAAAPSITNTGDLNTGILFPAADTVAVATGGSERLRVDSSGNVGIGTSSPATLGSNITTVTVNGTSGGGIQFQRTDATAVTGLVAALSGAFALGSITSTPVTFRTDNTERMRIDASGNLLVGTTSANGSIAVSPTTAAYTGFFEGAAGGLNLACRGGSTTGTSIRILNGSGTAVGSITYTASATAYNTSSDYRLKENIQPMVGALDKISQLKPVTYTWKADGSDGQGFIAHELQAVIPDCVTGEKDAVDAEGNPQYQGIDTSFLVATLVKAIQEQQNLIDDLSARVSALEG